MSDRFFEQPVLNSPYTYPSRHRELDAQGQSTQKVLVRNQEVFPYFHKLALKTSRQQAMNPPNPPSARRKRAHKGLKHLKSGKVMGT